MAEWSKATDSSSVLFGGVGSNPISATQKFYFILFSHTHTHTLTFTPHIHNQNEPT